MSRKVFNYCGISNIEINAPTNLLERLAENLEGEIDYVKDSDCNISIYQPEKLEEIIKDKNFDYLTINQVGTKKEPSIKYTRYNTQVRTIHQKSLTEYFVDSRIKLDESAGLICVRNYLSNHPELFDLPLLHASLVNYESKGILIAGNSRQGKTTSMVYMLEDLGAVFVGDENIILDLKNGKPKGLYVPRTPRARFSTIAQSGLSKVLENLELTNATQYIDSDAIEKIISSKSFHVDAGMAFSRNSFCDLLGTKSQEISNIDLILFPRYVEENSFRVRNLGLEEGVKRLSEIGLMRKSEICPKELTEIQLILDKEKFKGIDFLELSFSDIQGLRRGGFRI